MVEVVGGGGEGQLMKNKNTHACVATYMLQRTFGRG